MKRRVKTPARDAASWALPPGLEKSFVLEVQAIILGSCRTLAEVATRRRDGYYEWSAEMDEEEEKEAKEAKRRILILWFLLLTEYRRRLRAKESGKEVQRLTGLTPGMAVIQESLLRATDVTIRQYAERVRGVLRGGDAAPLPEAVVAAIATNVALLTWGQSVQETAKALGAEGYRWVTMHDDRVRPMHRDLDGTTQRWDSPPVTNTQGDRNHPTEDWNCRCVAVPTIPKEALGP